MQINLQLKRAVYQTKEEKWDATLHKSIYWFATQNALKSPDMGCLGVRWHFYTLTEKEEQTCILVS